MDRGVVFCTPRVMDITFSTGAPSAERKPTFVAMSAMLQRLSLLDIDA